MTFIHFLQYNNAVPIALGILFLGATGAFAATNPEAIYSTEKRVLSVDNTYIASVDLHGFTPRIDIQSVNEDEDNYYVAYSFSTIDVLDGVWKDVVRGGTLQVDKRLLGETKDLGLYATEQLHQLIDHESDRLKDSQDVARATESRKVVATVYGGLIGKFLDETTEELPGYSPVVVPLPPDLSNNSPVTNSQVASAETTFSLGTSPLSRGEIEALIQEGIARALATHSDSNTSPASTPQPNPEPTPEPVADTVPERNPTEEPIVEQLPPEPVSEPISESQTDVAPVVSPETTPEPISGPTPESVPPPATEPTP